MHSIANRSEWQHPIASCASGPVVEWFALVSAHPGQRRPDLTPGFDVLRIDEALEVRTRSLEAWQLQPGGYPGTAGASAYTFIPEYLLIAERDAATILVVDLRTGNRCGLIRQFDKVDNDDVTPTWKDTSTLLDELIDALATAPPSWAGNPPPRTDD